jgi:hypothetical protein
MASLQITQKCLDSENQVEFMLNDIGKTAFNFVIEGVESADSGVRSPLDGQAKVVVVTWQDHLDEVPIRENAVVIAVEITHELGALWKGVWVAVAFNVSLDVDWFEAFTGASVDATEGRVWSELRVLAQDLSLSFDDNFRLRDGLKQGFKNSSSLV